jgi:hypothetical protein
MEMCVDFSGLTAPSIPSSVCSVALQEVEVFDDVSERNSVVKTSSRLSKRKSMSHLEMRSASKTSIKSQEGRFYFLYRWSYWSFG